MGQLFTLNFFVYPLLIFYTLFSLLYPILHLSELNHCQSFYHYKGIDFRNFSLTKHISYSGTKNWKKIKMKTRYNDSCVLKETLFLSQILHPFIFAILWCYPQRMRVNDDLKLLQNKV